MDKKSITKSQTPKKLLKPLSQEEMYHIDGGAVTNTHKSVYGVFNFLRRNFD